MNKKVGVGLGILVAVLVLFPLAARILGGPALEPGPVSDSAMQTAQTAANALTQGDTAAVVAKFDATMKAALTAGKLQEVWGQVTSQFGAFKSLGTPETMLGQGQNVVIFPCTLERGTLHIQVAVNDGGEISGLYVKP